MKLRTFKLEEYLAKYEFTAPYLLCCSDSENFSVNDLLSLAGEKAIHQWNNLNLGYTEVQGSPALREKISSSLYEDMSMDSILCFAGAAEGILCSLGALLSKEDHCIVLTPCYQSLLEIPLSIGCSVSQVRLLEKNNWAVDIEQIKNVINERTKCVIINFPHNPTGSIITQKELDNLISLLDKHGIWLFSDEVYRLLGSPKEWSKPAADCYDKAISLNVLSKSYGLPGLRIGWVACENQNILDKIKKFKHYSSICNSAASEFLAQIAIEHNKKLLERNNKIVERNLYILQNFMSRHRKLFSWIKPQAGCIGFIKYKGNDSAKIFCNRLLNDKGILLLPGDVFEEEENYFRIGFGRNNMPDILEKFEEYLLRNIK